jgi:hypothetical protein
MPETIGLHPYPGGVASVCSYQSVVVETEVISKLVLATSATLSALARVAFAINVAPIWVALNITITAVSNTDITIRAAIDGPISVPCSEG